MLNWLRRKPSQQPHGVFSTLLDAVWNTAGTMTWADFFGTVNHERMFAGNRDTALKLSAVRCAIDIYIGMIGALPRRMYGLDSTTGSKTRMIGSTDHPASRMFLHYFNPELPSDEALSRIVYDILMDGNAYFIREMDTQGRTARGYYIHPSRVPRGNIYRATGKEKLSTGRMATSGELLVRIETGLTTRDKEAEAVLLPRTDIIHLKGKIPDNEHHRAFGFVENSTTALELYEASERFGRNFYTRGIATQMFLTTDNRLAPEVLKRIEANFEEDPHAPLEAIFKTRILEQGLKPVHAGIPFQHLQFIETRAFSVEDVARGLNIPPAMLHSYMGTKAGDVDSDKAISLFIQSGIGPLLSRLTSQLRSEIIPLPSQMLYQFEFETLYLYRNVIGEFSAALRNLFETGMIDRVEGRSLLGLHIDPSDPAANPRYVPVNLMTVEHSLLLEEGAKLANEATEVTTEGQKKSNDGMVSGEEFAAAQEATKVAQADAKMAKASKPPSGKMDKSPSKKNIDKRIRNAVDNVINGLRQYETRVLDQKRQTRPDDYEAAVTEFYAADGKFSTMLNEQLTPWLELVAPDDALHNLPASWLSLRKYPEA